MFPNLDMMSVAVPDRLVTPLKPHKVSAVPKVGLPLYAARGLILLSLLSRSAYADLQMKKNKNYFIPKTSSLQ